MKASRADSTSKLYLELKYCERCGNLRLRAAGCGQVYCDSCLRQMDELPAVEDANATGGAA